MDDLKIGDGAIDIDCELRRALAVTPSPEFVARVRTKIAEAPRPSMVSGWMKPAIAVASAATVVIAIAMQDNTPTTINAPGTTTAVSTAYRALTTIPFQSPSVVVVPPFSPQQRSGESAKRADVEPSMPEVIVNQADVAAFQQFVASVNRDEFRASFDETPKPTPWMAAELSASPLETAPLHNN